MSDDNIELFPRVNARKEEAELFLVARDYRKCNHLDDRFTLDRDAGKCFCRDCKEEVSAMFVLERMMKSESLWMRSRAAHIKTKEELGKRVRTKCQHCRKMTRIGGL